MLSDYSKPCPCGSGKSRVSNFDGYGIFLTYTCEACHERKMKTYRSDIHERYETDETIEED
jgi:hypothetical protein